MGHPPRRKQRGHKTNYQKPPASFWKDVELPPEQDTSADESADEAGTAAATAQQQQQQQQQGLRSMNMNSYASQPTRQTPRLQNTQKTGLGNGLGGWGMGLPSAGGFGVGAGAGLGGAPGLGARPGQLSGFAQVMGGGSGQGPIDMR